jgi:hypothetical protein
LLPDGKQYSDYLFWDGSAWNVDGDKIHLGKNSGQIGQGSNSIAIGANAGQTGQGSNSIAIGKGAGFQNQPDNSIILNNSGTDFIPFPGKTGSFYVNKIRDIGTTGSLGIYKTMFYSNKSEIVSIPFIDFSLPVNTSSGPTGPNAVYNIASLLRVKQNPQKVEGPLTFIFYSNSVTIPAMSNIQLGTLDSLIPTPTFSPYSSPINSYGLLLQIIVSNVYVRNPGFSPIFIGNIPLILSFNISYSFNAF